MVVVMLQPCGRNCNSVLTVAVPIVLLRAVIAVLRSIIALLRKIVPHGGVGSIVRSILGVLIRVLGVGVIRVLSRQLALAHL